MPGRPLVGDDLALGGKVAQPRGEVDRIAEHVVVPLDHRAEVESHAHAEPDPDRRPELVHAKLHLGRGLGRIVGVLENRHHRVADGLHHAAVDFGGAR